MEKLTPKQREEMRKAFDQFDLDGNGTISMSELHKLMSALGQQPSKAKVKKLIDSVDNDRNGSIDFTEFCNMMYKNMTPPDSVREQLEKAFDVFDKDQNGYLSEAELRAVLTSLGEKLSHAELDNMIKSADVDRDGRINKKEFVDIILGEQGLFTSGH